MAYPYDDEWPRALNGGTARGRVLPMISSDYGQATRQVARVEDTDAQPGASFFNADDLRRRLGGGRPATNMSVPLFAPQTPEEYQARNPQPGAMPAPAAPASSPLPAAQPSQFANVSSGFSGPISNSAAAMQPAPAMQPAMQPSVASRVFPQPLPAGGSAMAPVQDPNQPFGQRMDGGFNQADMRGINERVRAIQNSPEAINQLGQANPGITVDRDANGRVVFSGRGAEAGLPQSQTSQYQQGVALANSEKAQLAEIERQRSMDDAIALVRSAKTAKGKAAALGVLEALQNTERNRQNVEAHRYRTDADAGSAAGRIGLDRERLQQDAPLVQAKTNEINQNIEERADIKAIRQKIANAKTPEARRLAEAELYAALGKPQQKFQVVTERGADPLGNPTSRSYILDEQGNARPIGGQSDQKPDPAANKGRTINGPDGRFKSDGKTWVKIQ